MELLRLLSIEVGVIPHVCLRVLDLFLINWGLFFTAGHGRAC